MAGLGSGRTGDPHNNVVRLQQALQRARYAGDLDVNNAHLGVPEEHLPLLHFALLGYSKLLAGFLSSLGFELYGKSDLRFVEGVFKVLREEFSYFPRLSREQFFSSGFAEQKMILTADVLQLCMQKHSELARQQHVKRQAALGSGWPRSGKRQPARPAAYSHHAYTEPRHSATPPRSPQAHRPVAGWESTVRRAGEGSSLSRSAPLAARNLDGDDRPLLAQSSPVDGASGIGGPVAAVPPSGSLRHARGVGSSPEPGELAWDNGLSPHRPAGSASAGVDAAFQPPPVGYGVGGVAFGDPRLAHLAALGGFSSADFVPNNGPSSELNVGDLATSNPSGSNDVASVQTIEVDDELQARLTLLEERAASLRSSLARRDVDPGPPPTRSPYVTLEKVAQQPQPRGHYPASWSEHGRAPRRRGGLSMNSSRGDHGATLARLAADIQQTIKEQLLGFQQECQIQFAQMTSKLVLLDSRVRHLEARQLYGASAWSNERPAGREEEGAVGSDEEAGSCGMEALGNEYGEPVRDSKFLPQMQLDQLNASLSLLEEAAAEAEVEADNVRSDGPLPD